MVDCGVAEPEENSVEEN